MSPKRKTAVLISMLFILTFLPIFHFGIDGLRLWLFKYKGEGEYSEWHNGNLTNFPDGISTYTLKLSNVFDDRKFGRVIRVGRLPPIEGNLQIVNADWSDLDSDGKPNIHKISKLVIELSITEAATGRDVYHFSGPIHSEEYIPFHGLDNGWQLYGRKDGANPVDGFDFPASSGPFIIHFSVIRPLEISVLSKPATLQIFGQVGGK